MKRHAKVRGDPATALDGPAGCATATISVAESPTLANLQTAYQSETHAAARYLAFATEADDEGYAPVASVFRAVARAEEVHAKNHGEVIRGLGAEPRASVEEVRVESTHQNLEVAIIGEIYERDEMYPTVLHQSRSERNQPATRAFHLAQKAEAEHTTLFTQAAQGLERLRGEAVIYYVCPACGFTSAKAGLSRCPICLNPGDRFEEVN